MKPNLIPLIDFIQEYWIECAAAYMRLGIEAEADEVLDWLMKLEGVK